MPTIQYVTSISVAAKFHAQHRWKDCPIEEVAFLRNWHRHVFHVHLHIWVKHGDREKEFFVCQRHLRHFVQSTWEGGQWDKSCEMFAEDILHQFASLGWLIRAVEVSEDGENSAVIFPTNVAVPDPQELQQVPSLLLQGVPNP